MDKPEASDDAANDLVSIAIFNGGDFAAREIIENALAGAGIVHFIEGSTVHSVLVSDKDAESARRVLRSSEALKSRWHQFVE